MNSCGLLRVCSQPEDFFDFSHLTGDTIVVCPSPVLADSIANRLQRLDVTTQTISYFSRVHLQKILGDKFSEYFKRKSELNLLLSTVWKKQFGTTIKYSIYKQAFNLFTELRSYTLDSNIIEQVLEFYPENIRTAILWFDQIMQQMQFCDEHRGYQLLAENARSKKEECLVPQEKNIIFWGFSYFSGVQIDFINALAVRNHVEIPVSEYLLSKSIKSDWIQWFGTEDIMQGKSLREVNCSIIEIGKNRLAETIRRYSDKRELPQAILLMQKTPSLSQLLEISLDQYCYKVPTSILEGDIVSIFATINLHLAETITTQDFLDNIKYSLVQELQAESVNWKRVKSLSLVKSIAQMWFSLSEQNEYISQFDLELLLESALLDATRNFEYNLVRQPRGVIIGIESIDSITLEEQHHLYICATSQYSRMNTSGSPFTKEVEDVLKEIAPIRRYRFEFEALKEKINLLLNRKNTTLFIEKDLVKVDRGWGELLPEYKSKREVFMIDKPFSFKDDYIRLLPKKTYAKTKISASLIQSYVDCPAKFHFSRLDSFESPFCQEELLTPAELGQIEHEVIEVVISKEQLLDRVARELLDKYLDINNKQLDARQKFIYLNEIIRYAGHGIEVLNSIRELDSSVCFTFEQEFSRYVGDLLFYGRCDCIVRGERLIGILDFKRSSNSIPGDAAVVEYKKIQLPFYLLNYFSDITSVNFMGYISLADKEDCRFWANDKELVKDLFNTVGKSRIRITNKYIENWTEFFNQFEQFLIQQVDKLLGDSQFLPCPSSDSACAYCPVKVLCSNPIIKEEL